MTINFLVQIKPNVSVVERGTAPADWHLVSITAVHCSRQSKAQHTQIPTR